MGLLFNKLSIPASYNSIILFSEKDCSKYFCELLRLCRYFLSSSLICLINSEMPCFEIVATGYLQCYVPCLSPVTNVVLDNNHY